MGKKQSPNANSAYNAYIMREKINGRIVPTVKEITEDVLISSGKVMETKDIISGVETEVGNNIGKVTDDSISKAVSNSLKDLYEEGKANHVKDGYWEII